MELFFNKRSDDGFEIGLEFVLPTEVNAELRRRLSEHAPHLDKSIEQIMPLHSLTVVMCGILVDGKVVIFPKEVGVGSLVQDLEEHLSCSGLELLRVELPAGQQLCSRAIQIEEEFVSQLTALERLPLPFLGYRSPSSMREEARMAYMRQELRGMPKSLVERLEPAIGAANSSDDVRSAIDTLMSEIREQADKLESSDISEGIAAFAGPIRSFPEYVRWILRYYGERTLLRLSEYREPIGRREATRLLEMRIDRATSRRFDELQQTISQLLGVRIEAWQPKGGSAAEMDIDEFLAEANGAGIREALRLVLDVELTKPELILVEEPEVHLHPALERVVLRYLQDMSPGSQVFATTHSTGMVDASVPQNIYLICRDVELGSGSEMVTREDAGFRISIELGIRPSMIFMYDRLVFVEGPSDEGVFRELIAKLGLNLEQENVGFVLLNGVQNIKSLLASDTLGLLAERGIEVWIVVDRDEKEEGEIETLQRSARPSATVHVLARRELENYLICSQGLAAYINDKAQPTTPVSADRVEAKLAEILDTLMEEVVRLRLENWGTRYVRLKGRECGGPLFERLQEAAQELTLRHSQLEEKKREITESITAEWDNGALRLVPGEVLLDRTCSAFGVRLKSQNGDAVRLARHLRPGDIPDELRRLLTAITGPRKTAH